MKGASWLIYINFDVWNEIKSLVLEVSFHDNLQELAVRSSSWIHVHYPTPV